MSIDRNSSHAIALEQMPIFNSSERLSQVYAVLEDRKQGGFVMVGGSGPTCFVDARLLAAALFDEKEGAELLQEGNLSDRADLFYGPIGFPVGVELRKGVSWIVPVEMQMESEAEESHLRSDRSPRVIQLMHDPQSASRWYLNHEYLVNAATGQLTYKCQVGHVNYSIDHGTCGYCPRPLSAT